MLCTGTNFIWGSYVEVGKNLIKTLKSLWNCLHMLQLMTSIPEVGEAVWGMPALC